MKIVINDMSFRYQFYNEQKALEKLHEFIYVCKELESGKLKNVEGIISDYIDPSSEIIPGCKLFKLLQKFETKDEKSYLLGLLTNRPKISAEEKIMCVMNDKESWIWSQVFNHMMISLLSNSVFESPEVQVYLEDNSKVIRNLSTKIHIDYYGNELGKRIYVANDEKHKKYKENFYGKGKVASPMDFEANATILREFLYEE